LSVRSVAVIADAVHTLSDTGTSIIILIGFRIAKKPSDEEHPFGHGRAEPIAALIVAMMLIMAGFELMMSAWERLLHPQIEIAKINWMVVVILVGTVVVKEMMSRFARELGRMIDSDALKADFWHHRCDVFSTILVLAAMVCVQSGFVYVDGIAGVGVAMIVMYSGYVVARDAMEPLLGERPSQELLRKIEGIARDVKGVKGVHDVIAHRYGQTNLISLHIEVREDRPVAELHDLSEQVEELLERQMGGSVVVHIDPLNKKHERYREISDAIGEVTAKDERIKGFHDLRIVGQKAKVSVIFDITLSEQVNRQEREVIVEQLREAMVKRLPDVRLDIKAEPRFAYSSSNRIGHRAKNR